MKVRWLHKLIDARHRLFFGLFSGTIQYSTQKSDFFLKNSLFWKFTSSMVSDNAVRWCTMCSCCCSLLEYTMMSSTYTLQERPIKGFRTAYHLLKQARGVLPTKRRTIILMNVEWSHKGGVLLGFFLKSHFPEAFAKIYPGKPGTFACFVGHAVCSRLWK